MIMNRKNRLALPALLGLLAFLVGTLSGILFNGMAVWADFEASLFDSSLTADQTLSALSCPIFIGRNETGRIRAQVSNSLERPIAPLVRGHISEGLVTLRRQVDFKPSLEPGETKTVEWEVASQDAVWNRFILFRAYQFAVYPQASRTGTCGVISTNLPIGGNWITGLIVAISLAGTSSGIWLWSRQMRQQANQRREIWFAMTGLLVVSLLGIIAALASQMVLGLLIFVISVLLVIVLVAFFTSG